MISEELLDSLDEELLRREQEKTLATPQIAQARFS